MTIQMTCANPDCNKVLQARDDQAGKLTECPFCGTRTHIPKREAHSVAELEPDVQAETQPHVEEDEVVDWIGPAIQPPQPSPRPRHKPSTATRPSLTRDEFDAENVAAMGGDAAKKPVRIETPLIEDDAPRERFVGSKGSLVVGWIVFAVVGVLVAILVKGQGGHSSWISTEVVLSVLLVVNIATIWYISARTSRIERLITANRSRDVDKL